MKWFVVVRKSILDIIDDQQIKKFCTMKFNELGEIVRFKTKEEAQKYIDKEIANWKYELNHLRRTDASKTIKEFIPWAKEALERAKSLVIIEAEYEIKETINYKVV